MGEHSKGKFLVWYWRRGKAKTYVTRYSREEAQHVSGSLKSYGYAVEVEVA